MNYFIFLPIVVYSTALYAFLHKKTHIRLCYLYKDNILNIVLSYLISLFYHLQFSGSTLLTTGFILALTPTCLVAISILRFYRTPFRKVNQEKNGIVSPADGNIIYIKEIKAGEVPISVKNGRHATLKEFTQTGLLDYPCWLIGINMTPFDVHKNCAPVEGKLILNKHIDGEFLSLKCEDSLIRNERNSIVLDTPRGKVGVVQTASRMVRRIVTYKQEGNMLQKGEWYGMIKFGSQVDLIIPTSCKINVELKQQVYAKKTLIANW
jgi:phosphatidylserine decarboxylase